MTRPDLTVPVRNSVEAQWEAKYLVRHDKLGNYLKEPSEPPDQML